MESAQGEAKELLKTRAEPVIPPKAALDASAGADDRKKKKKLLIVDVSADETEEEALARQKAASRLRSSMARACTPFQGRCRRRSISMPGAAWFRSSP